MTEENDQADLFVTHEGTEAHARRGDPPTAVEAAAALNTTPVERAIMTVLLRHGGKTIHEITPLQRYPEITVSPRLRPLARKGLVEDSGVRRRHPHSNRHGIVWQLTEVGYIRSRSDRKEEADD